MYLVELLTKYTKTLLTATAIPLSGIVYIWGKKFQDLLPVSALEPKGLLISKIVMTLILVVLFLAALITILLHDHKKIEIEYEAKIKELTEVRSELEKRLAQKPEYAPGVKLKSHNSDLDKVKPRLTDG